MAASHHAPVPDFPAWAAGDLLISSWKRGKQHILHSDIGIFLRDVIKDHFKKTGMEITLKYIDPSYTIRSVPANPHDSALCVLLGHNAVHAGMAGRTGIIIGFWNQHFTHVPIPLAVAERKKIDTEGWVWRSVLSSTGQPRDMV